MTEEDWIAHDPDPVTAAELAALDPANALPGSRSR